MAILPEHPTITLDMVAVTNVINKAMKSCDEEQWKRFGMEQLGIIQMYLIRAMGSLVEPFWDGDAPMTLHDVGAILTAMSIIIKDHSDGFGDPNIVNGLREGCGLLVTAAESAIGQNPESTSTDEGSSIWDLGKSSNT